MWKRQSPELRAGIITAAIVLAVVLLVLAIVVEPWMLTIVGWTCLGLVIGSFVALFAFAIYQAIRESIVKREAARKFAEEAGA